MARRSLTLLRDKRELTLEKVALRHQLAILTRTHRYRLLASTPQYNSLASQSQSRSKNAELSFPRRGVGQLGRNGKRCSERARGRPEQTDRGYTGGASDRWQERHRRERRCRVSGRRKDCCSRFRTGHSLERKSH